MYRCAPTKHLFRQSRFPFSYFSAGVANQNALVDPSFDDYQFLERSSLPTYHFQKSLPRLPIPELSKTCQRYLKAQIPLLTPEEHTDLIKLTKDFEFGAGKSLDQLLRREDSNNKHTSYNCAAWFDKYLSSREPLPIKCNPSCCLKDAPGSQVVRATNIIVSTLRFMKSLRAEVLSPAVFHLNPARSDSNFFRIVTRLLPPIVSCYGAYAFKAYPLDMSQYPNLFNSTRIPKRVKDEMYSDESARHLVIIKNGRFYKVEVLDKNGYILPPDTIKACVDQIIDRGCTGPAPHPIGILTATRRDEWAAIREHLESMPGNSQALKLIDSAIMVLCLDDEKVKNDFIESLRMTLHGNGYNRWFDKSFNIIVTADGKAGLILEHTWGDGVSLLRFIQDIIQDNERNTFVNEDTTSNVDVTNLLKEIEFTTDPRTEYSIIKTMREFNSSCSELALYAARGEGFGKKFCKTAKIGSDSVMQLAMQVAHHKVFNSFVSTSEYCSTAAFKHGRIELARPNTTATRDFALLFNGRSQPSREIIRKMMQECSVIHNQLVKDAITGNGFDGHLFALKHLATSIGNLPEFYKHPAHIKISQETLCTSTLPTVEMETGTFGPLVPDGLGVGYSMGEEYWTCFLSSYPKSKDGASFLEAFQETMQQFHKLLRPEK